MDLEGKEIEELFKSQFESFESPVNDQMWSNISSRIDSAPASTLSAGSTVAGSSNVMTTIGVAVVTGLVGAGLTYGVMSNSDKEEAPQKIEVAQENIEDQPSNPIQFSTTVSEDEMVVESIVNSTPEEVEEKKIEKKELPKIKVTTLPKESVAPQGGRQSSAMDTWVSPRSYNDVLMHPENTDNISTAELKDEDVVVESIAKDEFMASIVASAIGGNAPLEVVFSNADNSDVNISWDFGDGNVAEGNRVAHVFEDDGIYLVEMIVSKGDIELRDKLEISVSPKSSFGPLPNIFTPNGDGTHDLLKISAENLESFYISVLNMEGEVLFTSDNIEQSWSGQDYAGNNHPVGQYIYVIDATGIDGKRYKFKQVVYLKR